MFNEYLSIYLKFFFLMTPFFVVSKFLSLTQGYSLSQKRKVASKVLISVILISIVLFFGGPTIFSLFGITLNSFRVGTGILLMLSAVNLVQGNKKSNSEKEIQEEDIAVVPLAMPVVIGPATTGYLLVMGVETSGLVDRIVTLGVLILAVICAMLFLFVAGSIEKLIGKQGIAILSKITGLVLSAMAAQMILTGIAGVLQIDIFSA
ncbi:MarC family protein [Spirochaeta cellobiosiphila]|uniref:MarC family protein n=1 Tax=Spirochaeta cellobiosiphila TaxID=504483 RepID=UPI00048C6CB7|nr:MarC family protein [Spirochaeta cellobiosiphila]